MTRYGLTNTSLSFRTRVNVKERTHGRDQHSEQAIKEMICDVVLEQQK